LQAQSIATGYEASGIPAKKRGNTFPVYMLRKSKAFAGMTLGICQCTFSTSLTWQLMLKFRNFYDL